MAELIDRQALKEHIGSYAGMFTDEIGFAVSLEAVLRGIDFSPTIDPESLRPKGEWVVGDDVDTCSECGAHGVLLWKFCPICGADMRGGE